MESVKSIKEMGVMIPTIPVMSGNEQEVEQKIADLKEMVTIELEKIITQSKAEVNISEQKLSECKNDFLAVEYFIKTENISDTKQWDELEKKWWKLNKKYLKLQEKLQKTGCDEYDLKYTGQSEFYQFLHEHPDNRRERIETPIQKEIKTVEEETSHIETEQEKLTTYSIDVDNKKMEDNLQRLYKKLLPVNE